MGEDWAQPTGCTEWSVREIVAHHSGCSAGFASWAAFRRQYLFNPYRRRGEPPVDGVNRCQVRDRDKWTTADLVTELREKGPKAIRTRQRLPWLLRKLPLPFGPPIGFAPLEYLTDPIYPRDM